MSKRPLGWGANHRATIFVFFFFSFPPSWVKGRITPVKEEDERTGDLLYETPSATYEREQYRRETDGPSLLGTARVPLTLTILTGLTACLLVGCRKSTSEREEAIICRFSWKFRCK